MKWCITGGCGFIGTSLIRRLQAMGGHRVRVLDDLTVGSRVSLAEAAPFLEKNVDSIPEFDSQQESVVLVVDDIRNARSLSAAAAGADVLVHLAANTGVQPSIVDPRRDCEINVLGTLCALEAARQRRVRRFVFASSGAPVAGNLPPIHERVPPRPVAPYGASKLAGEGYCSAYFNTFGVETVALRFGNVYGPFSSHKSSVVAKFIKAAMTGQTIEIYGDGAQTRDFIHVDDLIEALWLSATVTGVGGETFQVASGAETTINELAELIVPILRAAGLGDVRVEHASPLMGDAKRNFADTSKITRMLGWSPKISLPSGLEQTITWFMAADRSG
jgi:UDP-glucose 4-epimerase